MTATIDPPIERQAAPGHNPSPAVELSVVMPCLNEELSVGLCVRKALKGIARSGLVGEVVVCDNGSTDNSVAEAQANGARVVHQPRRGYGNAYLAGFAAARGAYIVMGDSDDTYDFTELHTLVDGLRDGNDYVLGSRFGGEIVKGAMPWTHRWIGNPVLTGMLNVLFGLRSSDAHSGMRAFTREALDRMGLCCEGMEFASEIVIKAAQAELKVIEVPITYHPRIGESKLNSLSDGWRHVRFMLQLSPLHLFLLPGLLFLAVGTLGQAVLSTRSVQPGTMSGLVLSVALLVCALLGGQAVALGSTARAAGARLGLATGPGSGRRFSLERGLVLGAVLIAVGVIGVAADALAWHSGSLTQAAALRPLLLAGTIFGLGCEVAGTAFLLSIVGIRTDGSTDSEPVPALLVEPDTDLIVLD